MTPHKNKSASRRLRCRRSATPASRNARELSDVLEALLLEPFLDAFGVLFVEEAEVGTRASVTSRHHGVRYVVL